MLLFVYGTMLRRGRNHARLYERNAVYIGVFRTKDKFDMYIRERGHVPLAVRADLSGRPIEGELYAVPDEEIEHIDMCEGHPNVYERQIVKLEGVTGLPDVHMYVYDFNNLGKPDEYTGPLRPADGVNRFIC